MCPVSCLRIRAAFTFWSFGGADCLDRSPSAGSAFELSFKVEGYEPLSVPFDGGILNLLSFWEDKREKEK